MQSNLPEPKERKYSNANEYILHFQDLLQQPSTAYDALSHKGMCNAMSIFNDTLSGSIQNKGFKELLECFVGLRKVESLSKFDSKIVWEDQLKLNERQKEAMKMAITNRFSLIQGPLGTGKTMTSAAIVYSICKKIKTELGKSAPNEIKQKRNVLVCASSNAAVDNIALLLHKLGLTVVRLYGENVADPPLKDFSFETLMKSDKRYQFAEKMKDIMEEKERNNETIEAYEHKRYLGILKRTSCATIYNRDVFCCTCIGAGLVLSKRLDQLEFETVLIDEVDQCTEPEALVPLVMATKQVILVGNPLCRPVVTKEQASKAAFWTNLLERLMQLGVPSTILN